jgi:hypothetical protein
MGLVGVALAVTVAGDVTVAPFEGLVTVKGKLLDGLGGGVASGAGNGLLCGVQVMGTGGVAGALVCVGVVVPLAVLDVPPPQPLSNISPASISPMNTI